LSYPIYLLESYPSLGGRVNVKTKWCCRIAANTIGIFEIQDAKPGPNESDRRPEDFPPPRRRQEKVVPKFVAEAACHRLSGAEIGAATLRKRTRPPRLPHPSVGLKKWRPSTATRQRVRRPDPVEKKQARGFPPVVVHSKKVVPIAVLARARIAFQSTRACAAAPHKQELCRPEVTPTSSARKVRVPTV
jgi:hypothetical protein